MMKKRDLIMKSLVSEKITQAYKNRFEKMLKYKYSKKGDELFIETVVAEAEQIDDLYVKAKVGDFIIECDEPKELGGSNKAPRPIDLFLASIANCLEISALLYFSFANLRIEKIKVKIEAKIDKRAVLSGKDAPLPGFYDFKIYWDIKSNENEKRIKRILKKVEKNCPLSGTLKRNHNFGWNVKIA
ncbi:MAG TPA: OsmC family peroxiredoxin [Candidatus Atribacteria bacterium]|nr:OsmC family peroxiredoxin [Candidatus Atribacteria bacterium]